MFLVHDKFGNGSVRLVESTSRSSRWVCPTCLSRRAHPTRMGHRAYSTRLCRQVGLIRLDRLASPTYYDCRVCWIVWVESSVWGWV